MLFNFRTPRTRPWDAYIKKLVTFLEKSESAAHIAPFFSKAQEYRQQLVAILDDCAKNNHSRPEDVIKILEQYLPILENICQGLKANVVDLKDKIEFVWTTVMIDDLNAKSLSYSINWELIMCYFTLALSHYQLAVKLHHENRVDANEKKKKMQKEEVDPIFDEPKNIDEPQILDDQEKIKEITKNLKSAAAIWNFCATKLYPVEIDKKQFQLIPETFRDIPAMLCNAALVNAQEFMIQLSVQTNKSSLITSKLAYGVADKLLNMDRSLFASLGENVYNSITQEFRLYLRLRSDLYKAIGLKYYGKLKQSEEKWGECLIYFQTAKNILNRSKDLIPKKQNQLTVTLNVIKSSIDKQLASVNQFYKTAKDDNDKIYFEPMPESIDLVVQPESKFQVKVDEYKGYADL